MLVEHVLKNKKWLFGTLFVGFLLYKNDVPKRLYYGLKHFKKNKTIGLRKPGTDIGSWDGAFVGGYDKNSIIIGVYENKQNSIVRAKHWGKVLEEYSKYKNLGWNEMTEDDIKQTSGIDLNETD